MKAHMVYGVGDTSVKEGDRYVTKQVLIRYTVTDKVGVVDMKTVATFTDAEEFINFEAYIGEKDPIFMGRTWNLDDIKKRLGWDDQSTGNRG